MEKLTAIIPTGNEEHNIVAAIKSINFADEIMIVDSFSKDKTLALATPISDTILQRKFDYPSSQKNWAIPQAKHQWVLILDADERITNELKQEIIKTINSNVTESGFWIKRENYFMGKKVKFSGWRGDKVIRLFKRDECRYEDKYVHEEIITNGKIGKLKNKLIHNTFKNKEDYLEKLEKYARWQAMDYDKKTRKITAFHTFLKPIFRFIKHYFFQLGILDGYVGFTISTYQAKAVKMRYFYLKKYRNEKRNR